LRKVLLVYPYELLEDNKVALMKEAILFKVPCMDIIPNLKFYSLAEIHFIRAAISAQRKNANVKGRALGSPSEVKVLRSCNLWNIVVSTTSRTMAP
jgi:hypothetical protein